MWAIRSQILAKKSKILFYHNLFMVKKKILSKWANRLFLLIFSFLMSDVSESLILLTKNEQMSESHIFLSKSLIFEQKMSDSLGYQMSEFPALTPYNSMSK